MVQDPGGVGRFGQWRFGQWIQRGRPCQTFLYDRRNTNIWHRDSQVKTKVETLVPVGVLHAIFRSGYDDA